MKNNITILLPDKTEIHAILSIPNVPKGVIIFAHGSGSSRLSPRNNFVANVLNKAGFATLLADLLTEEEDNNYDNRFDIDLLSRRLIAITDWARKNTDLKDHPIGYFGASTGAAVALDAAAADGYDIKAVVSRGGRPDLSKSLPLITIPTLLIVGGYDDVVIDLNQKAYDQLKCEKEIKIVEGATHLFEEKGTLEQVAELAKEWFVRYLK